MNWENVKLFLENFTQLKHYQILSDKYKLPRKNSRVKMVEYLHDELMQPNLVGSIIPEDLFEDWLALHQIDGNNYTYVYNLETKTKRELLQNIYLNRDKHIKKKISEFNHENSSEELDSVLPNLEGVTLVGIHRDNENGKFIFSYIAPCIISGTRLDGSTRLLKRIFFAHCVLFDESRDLKVIFNPTSNLINVNGVRKDRSDWTPIANMFFEHFKHLVGKHTIIAPRWIPRALYKLAEDATNHNNPEITELAFNSQEKIVTFAESLLKQAGIDVYQEKNEALLTRLTQDIQQSFEAQLVEKLGFNEDEESFILFRQRSDGITHTINVESRNEGLNGTAAQAARRSRSDGDLDLIGIIYKTQGNNHKFLVEQGSDAYLIRGTNTFIEEEVVNVVIRKLNEYREQIQSTAFNSDPYEEGTALSSTK